MTTTWTLIAITAAAVALTGCPVEDDPAPVGPEAILCGADALYSEDHEGCDAMDAVGDEECYCFIGFAWDGLGCTAVNGCECQGEDCTALTETEEECLAAHDSCVDPADSEPEPEPVEPEAPAPISCGDAALHVAFHDQCAPMDAAADGLCYCHIGYAWDGSDCVGLGGCECVGADCNAVFQSMEDCVDAHEGC